MRVPLEPIEPPVSSSCELCPMVADDLPLDDGPTVPGGPPMDAKVLEAKTLFDGRREVWIAHFGEHYRLRLTRKGRLILTK